MPMPLRYKPSPSGDEYRFGFGGHEKVDEVSGTGNTVDMGDRWLDTRLGRTLKMDRKAIDYTNLSPYSFAANNPIIVIDPNGEDIELIIGKAYTDENGKENPYGHVALRVFNKEEGYDFVYDFGRYGATSGGIWGVLPDGSNPSGEGILHVYKDGNVYIKSQQSYRNSIGYTKSTTIEEDQAVIQYYKALTDEGVKQLESGEKSLQRDRFKLKQDYWIKGPNCTTVSQDGLKQIGLDFLGNEYDPRDAEKIMEKKYKTLDLKRTEYEKGGNRQTTYDPKKDKNPQPLDVGGGNYISPNLE